MLRLEGRSARGEGGTGLAWQPGAQGHREEVQGLVSPRTRGWGAPVPGNQAWGLELCQGLGSHREVLVWRLEAGRQGGGQNKSPRERIRPDQRRGPQGHREDVAESVQGRGMGLVTDRTGVCAGRGAGGRPGWESGPVTG